VEEVVCSVPIEDKEVKELIKHHKNIKERNSGQKNVREINQLNVCGRARWHMPIHTWKRTLYLSFSSSQSAKHCRQQDITKRKLLKYKHSTTFAPHTPSM
jgi:hypothetical protein